MTDILNRKSMSVVLVACSPARAEGQGSVRPQPVAATHQAVEPESATPVAALDSPPVAISSRHSHTGLPPDGPQGRSPGDLHLQQGLHRVVHDILARGRFGSVEVGYCRSGYPSVEEAIEHAITHGARRIVVVPMVFSLAHPSPCEYFAEAPLKDLPRRIAEAQARHPDTDIVYAGPPFDHERQVDLILSKIREYEPETLKVGVLTLLDLAAGEIGMVHELDGGTHFRSRMASLGFTPGVRLKMMQNYGHGAVIVSLRGTRVALGRGEARKVVVARRADQGQPGF
jgi:ferrous iron transport protein A